MVLKMKKILLITILSVITTASFARNGSSYSGYSYGSHDTEVSGYTRSNGTYVEPYHRSSENNTQRDNYSSIGNTNPYTGEEGTHVPSY